MLEHGRKGRNNATRYLVCFLWGLLRVVIAIASIFLILSVLPMLGKRIRMDLPDRSDEAALIHVPKTQTVRTPETLLPPIEYGIIRDGADKEIRDALIGEVASMRDTSGFWPPTWLTLPHPIIPANGEPAFKHVRDLMNEVYADYPELSVYTDGQCISATGFLSQWRIEGEEDIMCDEDAAVRLPWGNEAAQEENAKELREVTERLDAVARELADATDSSDYAKEREALGSDMLYAALVYRWVGSRTRYSDGRDDTSHANDIYGATIEEESQCYGTACAMKALLERGGIPAFVATGGREDGTEGYRHAWVVVRMGGQWLSLDGTGAQVLRAEDPIDPLLISERRGTWFSFMIPLDERLEASELELEPKCRELMRRYEALVEPIGGSRGVTYREWLG